MSPEASQAVVDPLQRAAGISPLPYTQDVSGTTIRWHAQDEYRVRCLRCKRRLDALLRRPPPGDCLYAALEGGKWIPTGDASRRSLRHIRRALAMPGNSRHPAASGLYEGARLGRCVLGVQPEPGTGRLH